MNQRIIELARELVALIEAEEKKLDTGISIVIPTYEQKGIGHRLLTELLKSIEAQEITVPYNVIVSDSAKDGSIKKVCDQFPFVSYTVSPVYGAAENINNAISLATYDKVKVMCQDDKFLTINAIDLFCRALDDNGWVISNSVSINAQSMPTKRHSTRYIHNFFRKNYVGMPSVTAFRKTDTRLNYNLTTCIDMYFYHQLAEQFGDPGVIKEYTVAQRYHDASLSRNQVNTHEKDVNWLIEQGLILR